MTTGWGRTTLGRAGTWVSGGTPSTSNPAFWGGDIPWMSSKSLTEFFVRDSDRRVTEAGASHGTRLVPAGTILMVVRGMSLKTEFRMGITQREVALSQDLKGLLPLPTFNPLFLAYAIRAKAPEVLDIVDEAGHGTGRLQTDRLYALELPVPPITEQDSIATTLSSLDSKIASNGRAIDLIQELLRAKFQELVSNEPVTYGPLAEVATMVKGVSYRSAELEPSRTSLVTLKSFDRRGGYKESGLKPYIGPYKPAQVIEPGEVVVAQTDLTQGAEVVGRAVRVPAAASAEVLVASLDLAIVRPGPMVTAEYLLALLMDENFRQHCRERTNGTTVLHLASDAIGSYRAPLLCEEAQQRYSAFAAPMLALVDALNVESRRLAAVRDALLPSLMAGRIRSAAGVVA